LFGGPSHSSAPQEAQQEDVVVNADEQQQADPCSVYSNEFLACMQMNQSNPKNCNNFLNALQSCRSQPRFQSAARFADDGEGMTSDMPRKM